MCLAPREAGLLYNDFDWCNTLLLILILVVFALIIAKRFNKKESEMDTYLYEDEMDEEELKDIDEELH